MGLFDIFKRKDERAIPEPGTPEFDAAVSGSALPEGSVEMGQGGWQSAAKPAAPAKVAGATDVGQTDAAERAMMQLGIDPSKADVSGTKETIDLRDTGARDKVQDVLRQRGIDPDKEGQTIDASTVPGLQEAIFSALGDAGFQLPQAGGFGGGVSAPQQDPLAVVEALAAKRDAGEITEAEFEAQKKRLLGS